MGGPAWRCKGVRGGRWRSRSATNCRRCWRGCWRAATSGSTRFDGLSRSDHPQADARSPYRNSRWKRRRSAWRMRRRAGRRSRSSAITTSMARPRRRCWPGTCAIAGSIPIHIPDRIFEAMGPTSRRCGGSRTRARRCLSPSIAAPPASSRWRKLRKLGMSVVVIDHHQTGDELPEVDALVNPNRAGRPVPASAISQPSGWC